MSQYQVESSLGQKKWQIDNKAAGNHYFVCDVKGAAPGPVDYFAGAINSCISTSVWMVAESRQVAIKDFSLQTQATTKDFGHGVSKIVGLTIAWHLKTNLSVQAEQDFQAHVLRVSTVYQTVKDWLPIKIIQK